MVIPVLIEPNYANAIWVRQLLDGIIKEAQRRKYRPVVLNADQFEHLNYDTVFGNGPRIIILAAVSVSYVPTVMRFFTGNKIEILLVNYDEEDGNDALGTIRMNCENATTALLQYLWNCGRKKSPFMA